MMRILEWDKLSPAERGAALARPAQESRADIAAVAADVVNTVRRDGDPALFSYTERFDSVKLESLAVSAEEFAQARQSLTRQQLRRWKRPSPTFSSSMPANSPSRSLWKRCPECVANGSFAPFQQWACTCRLVQLPCPLP